MADIFSSVPPQAVDPILGLVAAYKKDSHEKKVDLGVGAYRNEAGQPLVFEAVREAERRMVCEESLYKEYLPIDGVTGLAKLTQDILFGSTAAAVREDRICSAQSISGTGAVRLVAEFIKRHFSTVKKVYIPSPTWAIHRQIFASAGFEVLDYAYWDKESKGLNIKQLAEDLENADEGSVVVLHTCAHNPTGVDPTRQQWESILNVATRRKLIPLLDTAYQGFASGDTDEDAWAVRLFEASGVDFFVAHSFAKCMGLYGERAGMVHLVCRSKEAAVHCLSQLKFVIRCLYSSPPKHGGEILYRVLTDSKLREMWLAELKIVAGRLMDCRKSLRAKLEAVAGEGTWKHLTDQRGMFGFTGLTKEQCERLTSKWHIYLLRNGRISLAGLNSSNIDYVADCILEVS